MTDIDRYLSDEIVEKAAKELYEQWASRDNETRMFAPMWDSLGLVKFGWIRDARIALEDAAPDIIRQAKAEALADAADEIEAEYDRRGVVAIGAQYQYNSGVLDGLDIAERVVRDRADEIAGDDS